MILARVVAVCAALLLTGAASTAPPPPWIDGLAAILADASHPPPTSSDLPERFAPFLLFDKARCRTMRLPASTQPGPGTSTAVPIVSALVAYDDDAACDGATRLQLLQFTVRASDAVVGQMQASLAARLPAACFDGPLPSEPRRRAPPRTLVGWRAPSRVVLLARDEGAPGTATLSLLILPDPAATIPAGGLRDEVLAGLPASCR